MSRGFSYREIILGESTSSFTHGGLYFHTNNVQTHTLIYILKRSPYFEPDLYLLLIDSEESLKTVSFYL